MMNRRRFIKTLGCLTGSTSVVAWGWNSLDPLLPNHCFVHIQIEGGADMIQSLDPMSLPSGANEIDLWRGYLDSDIYQKGSMTLGPAASGLIPHALDCAIVRGIWMSTGPEGSHESCRTYMASGRNAGWKKSNIMPSEFSIHLGTGFAGSLVNTNREFSMSLDSPGYTEIQSLENFESELGLLHQTLFNLPSPFGWKSAFQSRNSFAQSTQQLAKFGQYLKKLRDENGGAPLSVYKIMAEGIGQAITSQGFINLGGDYKGPGPGLDSHSDHVTLHLGRQKWHWDAVAEIFKTFKETEFRGTGDSVFSHTTFVVTNEFSRLPYLNGTQGKDHNTSTNSALLAGKGIKGGTVVGGSHLVTSQETKAKSKLFGMPIDFQTGKVLTRSEVANLTDLEVNALIKPEHIVATLASVLGIDPKKIRTIRDTPIRTLPGITL